MIKVLIIDDEKASRLLLKAKLERNFNDINVMGLAKSAQEGRSFLEENSPDLIFLDVSMPKESGFDFLESLTEINFEVIFVTGYDQYAIQAIEKNAMGYVLKPISDEKIVHATYKAVQKINGKNQQLKDKELLSNLISNKTLTNKIAIPFENEVRFVPVSEILFCKGEDGYTKIICKKESLTSSYSIGNFSNLLKMHNFYAPHKSYLINLDYIVQYKKDGTIMLEGNHSVPVSARKKKDFLELLKNS